MPHNRISDDLASIIKVCDICGNRYVPSDVHNDTCPECSIRERRAKQEEQAQKRNKKLR